MKISPVQKLTQSVRIVVKDASKVGEAVIIGDCMLPLSKLLNQLNQTMWIPLQQSIGTAIYSQLLFI